MPAPGGHRGPERAHSAVRGTSTARPWLLSPGNPRPNIVVFKWYESNTESKSIGGSELFASRVERLYIGSSRGCDFATWLYW
jgi:hypothetical protein